MASCRDSLAKEIRPPMKSRIVPSRLRMKPAIVPEKQNGQHCRHRFTQLCLEGDRAVTEGTYIPGNHIGAVFSSSRACCTPILPVNGGSVVCQMQRCRTDGKFSKAR